MNLVTNNMQFVACIRMRESDRLMLFLPFYHIYGMMVLLNCGMGTPLFFASIFPRWVQVNLSFINS